MNRARSRIGFEHACQRSEHKPATCTCSFDAELEAMEKKLRAAERAAEKKGSRQTLEIARLQKLASELRASNDALTDETAALNVAKVAAEEETRKAICFSISPLLVRRFSITLAIPCR